MKKPENQRVCETPVVWLIFNRPDCTARSLAAIRAVSPRRLYVVADGARTNRPEEKAWCAEVRRIVEIGIDWPCEVCRDYSEVNLGCAVRVSTGLNAVFNRESQAIIIEDDCVAEPSFFRYCEELLRFYAHREEIFVISGSNQQYREFDCEFSYFFSRYNHCWGWATWARAWKHFDFNMSGWSDYSQSGRLKEFFGNARLADYFTKSLDEVASGRLDSWAYRWSFACWRNNALSILPRRPLIKNIGFDERATHTRSARAELVSLVTQPMDFPLSHPPAILRDRAADARTESIMYRSMSRSERWLAGIKRRLKLSRG